MAKAPRETASEPLNLPQIAGPDDFARAFAVSRETVGRLETYVGLLNSWQKTINLVAPSTLDRIWHRHFADSAQLVGLALPSPRPLWVDDSQGQPRAPPSPSPLVGEGEGGESRTSAALPSPLPSLLHKGEGVRLSWLDLGSGAGFPGLVVAILLAEQSPLCRVTLVESDQRKAAFLREVARQTSVAVDILCARIETEAIRAKLGSVDVVSARALAPLPQLLKLAYPFFGPATLGLFLKGRDAQNEINEALVSYEFSADLVPSVTDPDGRVILVRALRLKD